MMLFPKGFSVERSADAPDETWIGRIVYESAANVVSLSEDPTTEEPFGVVENVDAVNETVSCVVDGPAMFRIGGNITAGTTYQIAAGTGGKAVAGADDQWNAGRIITKVNLVANDVALGIFSPHKDTVSDEA